MVREAAAKVLAADDVADIIDMSVKAGTVLEDAGTLDRWEHPLVLPPEFDVLMRKLHAIQELAAQPPTARQALSRDDQSPRVTASEGSGIGGVLDVLAAEPERWFTVAEVHDALVERGWTTTSPRPLKAVANLLSKVVDQHPDKVNRPARARYTWGGESAPTDPATGEDDSPQRHEEVVQEVIDTAYTQEGDANRTETSSTPVDSTEGP